MIEHGKERPLVTVLMPVYNSPDVMASVDSVLRQDYDGIEFILIDDHSQNFSAGDLRAYLEKYAGRNIRSWRVVENSQNLGLVKTLNIGIRLSTGEILFNLAGDDLFADESVLRDWVRAFRETGAIVITGVRENYDRDFSRRTGVSPDMRQRNWLRALSPAELFERISMDNFLSGCCTAYTRKFFEKFGLYDERYRLIEDFPTTLRYLRQGGQITFFERTVIKYRDGGISSAGRISDDYRRDIHAIYENEIIPYTKYPRRARNWLRRWERDIVFDRKYLKMMEKYGQIGTLRIPLKVWYYLHHPRQAARKIMRRQRNA